jgi:hypothetical protein
VAARSNSSRARTRAGSARRRTAAVDGYVLRSCRLDRAVDAVRPRGSARADRRLRSRDQRDGRRFRRLCRQVHGRRGCWSISGNVSSSRGIAGAMALCCAGAVHPGQTPAHSVCVPHRTQPGDYDNKSLPFSRFSTSGGPKLSIRAPIVIPLVGSVGGLKLFATAAMENNLSTS